MQIIAIDPGAKGAIACYTPADRRLALYDMPVRYAVVGKTRRPRVDAHALASLISVLTLTEPDAVYVEQVSGYTSQSASASFTFGSAYGVLIGCLAASGVTPVHVQPRVWRDAHGLSGATKLDRKRASRAAAARLFPSYERLWRRADSDGKADAALIAVWGASRHHA